jgi:hypothetical protein
MGQDRADVVLRRLCGAHSEGRSMTKTKMKKRGPGGRPRLFDQLVGVRLPNKMLLWLDQAVVTQRRKKPEKQTTRADIVRDCIQKILGPKGGSRG